MVFRLFRKDPTQLKERGDRHFVQGRYAEARHEYEDALNILQDNSDDTNKLRCYLQSQLVAAGNELAAINLDEAEFARIRGDNAKAQEHAELAMEQAEDEAIREKARIFLDSLSGHESQPQPKSPSHNCSGCGTHSHSEEVSIESTNDYLSLSERFELLIQPLPGNLPERYRNLGEEFAFAYTAIHEERLDEGLRILNKLSEIKSSDIVDYEIAIIHFHQGRLNECESLLRHALTINEANPLCHLGLVQLLLETGRFAEAIPLLERMISDAHLPDQATIMLGEVLQVTGNDDAALMHFIQGLNYPSAARAAAERAIPLLNKQGRTSDAAAIAKQYLKGCC
jgi:tetratricopeptide (TPR) repeat protein